MWITTKEMATEWGGKNDDLERAKKRDKLVKLPFNYCNLTMTPFKDPYCTEDGAIFDLLNIVPFIRKHEKHPMTGEALAQKDLIKLNFHKNEKEEFHCPVMFK
jgi:peptidyl-prolyl cis-trans isomerase-like protein 2